MTTNNNQPKMCERCGEALQRKQSGTTYTQVCQHCGAEEESHG